MGKLLREEEGQGNACICHIIINSTQDFLTLAELWDNKLSMFTFTQTNLKLQNDSTPTIKNTQKLCGQLQST